MSWKCLILDKSAYVSCSENYMRIELDRNFFNVSAYSSITFRDSRCRATWSSSFISLGTIPSQCGSTREETYDNIIYRNTVIMRAKTTQGLITRESDIKIRLTCSYKRTGNVSSVSFKPISKVNVTEGKSKFFLLLIWFYMNYVYHDIITLIFLIFSFKRNFVHKCLQSV